MWLAVAGIVVGGVVLVMPDLGWEIQFILFSALGIISVYTGRNYLKKNPIISEDENLNDRGARYVGKTYTIERALINGEGKIRVGDSLWLVRGDFDAEVGTAVKVTGADGVVLIVSSE
jgi:membrane protein implicated in regulation of membrane protease activity